MIEVLDSGWLRVGGYGVAALVAILVGVMEVRSTERKALTFWPPFWFLSAALIASTAVARVGGIGDLLVDLGRETTQSGGWYDQRRGVQATAVITIAVVWVVAVIAAIWRVPPRRRRYLPTALVLFTLECFAAIRVVSLHQVDAVLYHRQFGGVRWVAIIELALLGLTIAAVAMRVLSRPKTRLESPMATAPI